MDLDLVLDPSTDPDEVVAVCVEAERLGVRAVWASNYHQDRDPFLSLARPALETSTLLLGVLAVSPWELPPLRMASPTGPAVYSCASGPRMIELGAELADGIQLSDFTVAEVPGAIEHVLPVVR